MIWGTGSRSGRPFDTLCVFHPAESDVCSCLSSLDLVIDPVTETIDSSDILATDAYGVSHVALKQYKTPSCLEVVGSILTVVLIGARMM